MPSGISATGLAYLDNPRRLGIGNSKTFALDASMFLRRDGTEAKAITAVMRYFNGNDLDLSEPGVYVFNSWIGQPHNSDKDIGDSVCDFVGDIQWLMPLHEDTYNNRDDYDEASSDNGEARPKAPPILVDRRLPRIFTEYPLYVNFSGLAFNNDKDAGTFDMDIEQYTQISKGGPITVFPMSCWIKDSPRWAKSSSGKPVPYPGKFISASGYLVGVKDLQVAGSPHKRRFKIEVDNVVYLGSAPAANPSTPAASSSAHKRKASTAFDGTPAWVKRHTNSDGPSSSPGF
ncbi:hypothetical protein DFH09DRAFT_1091823 [Mycena vulgaris]|nr:hypothetical protein DFH09DRAFT_1091823 [Mycena vulgaris]